MELGTAHRATLQSHASDREQGCCWAAYRCLQIPVAAAPRQGNAVQQAVESDAFHSCCHQPGSHWWL